MSQNDVLSTIHNIASTIRNDGELGVYTFEFKSTSKDKEVLVFYWDGNLISFNEASCIFKYWTDKGVQYKEYKRFSTEEERFQGSTVCDVFCTECEDALALLIRNLFGYLRDGMSAYREELYVNGLD